MNYYFLTKKTMGNILKSAVLATTLTMSSANAATVANASILKPATHVAESGESIDFKSKLVSIDKQINSIQTQIKLIIQKGELSDADVMKTLELEDNIQKLKKQKHNIKMAIIDNRINKKKETVAIIDKQNHDKEKTITTIKNQNQYRKEKLSIERQKLKALQQVSSIIE